MAWIEVHDTLREHHKTYALAAELRMERFAAVGLVVSLWTWAINHAQDGDLNKYPPEAIASACMWRKKPEALIDALINTGFIDADYFIHDWDMYAGRLIDKREANARRNREARARNASRDAQQAQTERITSASHDGATVPNLTVPNHTPIVPKGTTGALFDRFWAAYPKKVAKITARKSFDKLKPDEELLALILEGLEKYKQSDQWTRDGGRYVPNPATWLNQRRWEDELTDNEPQEDVQWTTL